MKAKITLPCGTIIEAEGTADEIRQLATGQLAPFRLLPLQPQTDPQLFTPVPGCCCPLGDPNFKGGPFWWRGNCPVHSPSWVFTVKDTIGSYTTGTSESA